MSEKEKAKELVNRYSALVPIEFGGMDERLAIECALITVDEILKVSISYEGADYEYYQEVKKELEAMK